MLEVENSAHLTGLDHHVIGDRFVARWLALWKHRVRSRYWLIAVDVVHEHKESVQRIDCLSNQNRLKSPST